MPEPLRRGPWLLLALLLASLPGAAAARANALADSPSRYLAMHGHDPVDWQPWGPEVLARARREGRLIYVSSGYYACHWCHVMHRESYSDPAIAALLNRDFIPVKVDRELLPGLDAYLIDFVEATQGHAGWPLNVVLTPEGYPLGGFTYAPPSRFKRLLRQIGRAWARDPAHLRKLAKGAAEELATLYRKPSQPPPADPTPLVRAFHKAAMRLADDLQGGFGRGQRFPMAPHLEALLTLQEQTPDAATGHFLALTLEQMATKGLRDHLAGGFFRYTVDPGWLTPHFEKMLYSQALDARLFLHAARALKRPDFAAVARDTLDFTLREMAAPQGGYIASLAADSAGREGGAYLWSPARLDALLQGDERRLAARVWGMQGRPPHDGGWLPLLAETPAEAARALQLDPARARTLLDSARSKLLRARRPAPRDAKPVAAWNGLLLSALATGERAWPGRYRQAGDALARFLSSRLWDGHELHRSLGPRGPLGHGAIDDYAFVATGLADWAAAAGAAPPALARRLLDQAWARFFDGRGWLRDPQALLPLMPREPALADSPLPSPSAALIELARRPAFADRQRPVRAALGVAYGGIRENPFNFPSTVLALADPPPANGPKEQP